MTWRVVSCSDRYESEPLEREAINAWPADLDNYEPDPRDPEHLPRNKEGEST